LKIVKNLLPNTLLNFFIAALTTSLVLLGAMVNFYQLINDCQTLHQWFHRLSSLLCFQLGIDIHRYIYLDKSLPCRPPPVKKSYSKYDHIAVTSIGVNDGINYVDEIIDSELCRETFQMIFHHMNQD
jgi:hypothetical protein